MVPGSFRLVEQLYFGLNSDNLLVLNGLEEVRSLIPGAHLGKNLRVQL